MAIPKQLIDGIDRLEPLPVAVQRLIALSSDIEDVHSNDVAEIVELDAALAASVLREANSGAVRGRQPIEELTPAVTRVGVRRVIEVGVGDGVRRALGDSALYDMDRTELFHHSACSAAVARALMQRRPVLELPPATPVAALVHDIGKIVMTDCFESACETLRTRCKDKELTWFEAEREVFGTDHAAVGSALAESWGLPSDVQRATACHHTVDDGEPDPILDAVALSNYVVKMAGVGLGAEGMNFTITDGSLVRLGVDYLDLSKLCLTAVDTARALEQEVLEETGQAQPA